MEDEGCVSVKDCLFWCVCEREREKKRGRDREGQTDRDRDRQRRTEEDRKKQKQRGKWDKHRETHKEKSPKRNGETENLAQSKCMQLMCPFQV